MDCVVVLTDHSSFDYEMIVAHSAIVVDCRNVLRNFRELILSLIDKLVCLTFSASSR
jgi:UDP-N-acetyl-D-mannosaminuronate dehydrogenase